MNRKNEPVDPLDWRQGFGRHYQEFTRSGLTMQQEIDQRIRMGPHRAYIDSLLGTNKASPEKMRQLMARLLREGKISGY
jgi:hypothetical protein